MDTEIIFENAAGTARIYDHSHQGCGEIALFGSINHVDYKEAFNTFATFLQTKEYAKVIFNNQALVKDTLPSRAWFLTKFIPNTHKKVKASLYRVAVIVPSNRIQRITVETIAKAAKAIAVPMEVQFFENTAEALEWV